MVASAHGTEPLGATAPSPLKCMEMEPLGYGTPWCVPVGEQGRPGMVPQTHQRIATLPPAAMDEVVGWWLLAQQCRQHNLDLCVLVPQELRGLLLRLKGPSTPWPAGSVHTPWYTEVGVG